jgi:1-acyl-sn-glycerol-3-phosphate acyltransferase
MLVTALSLIGLVLAFATSLRWLVQPLLRLALRLRYRLVVVGRENIPRSGPVLVAANHVTWLDGFLLAAACPRRGHALVNAGYIDWPVLGRWARWIGLIPVPLTGPKAVRALFRECREVLDRGEALAIFPEAQITRNGMTGHFHRGLETILAGREEVPVVPTFLGNLWGSVFSFSGGRFFRKRPHGWRRTVVIAFGPPVSRPVSTFAVRQAVLVQGVRAVEAGASPLPSLETLDPSLPHYEHVSLGPLTGSTADHDAGGVRQTGHRPGTIGHPLPGIALRVVDPWGRSLGPDAPGRVECLQAGRDWVDTGLFGSIDRDGFVTLRSPER